MPKQNCWEIKKCGREPGGARKDLGICAAAVEHRLHGCHEGKHAGRACWVVAGTLCGGVAQGSFAQKFGNCEKCEFYQMVKKEEGASFTLSLILLQKLKTAAPQKAAGMRATAPSE